MDRERLRVRERLRLGERERERRLDVGAATAGALASPVARDAANHAVVAVGCCDSKGGGGRRRCVVFVKPAASSASAAPLLCWPVCKKFLRWLVGAGNVQGCRAKANSRALSTKRCTDTSPCRASMALTWSSARMCSGPSQCRVGKRRAERVWMAAAAASKTAHPMASLVFCHVLKVVSVGWASIATARRGM